MSSFNFLINSIIFIEITLALSRTNLPALHYQVNNAREAKAFVSLLKSIFNKNTGKENSFQETELQRFPLEPSRYELRVKSEESDDDYSSDSLWSSETSDETDEAVPLENEILRSKSRGHKKTHKSKNDDDEDDSESDESSEEKVPKKRFHKVKSHKSKKKEKKRGKKEKHDKSEFEEKRRKKEKGKSDKHNESETKESASREVKKIKVAIEDYESLSFMLRSCNTRALKVCKRACRRTVKNACASYTCKKEMKKALRKSCKRACKDHMKEDDSSDYDQFR